MTTMRRAPRRAGIYGPVTDWATDIDHADPAYNPQAPEIWDELRESGCPVAHTDRYGGMWAPITHELVREVAYDTEHFTSRAVVVSTSPDPGRSRRSAAPRRSPATRRSTPLARRLLLPPFAPKQIEPWEHDVRALCRQRLDDIGDVEPGDDVVDAAVAVRPHIPVNVIARMLGFPTEDDDMFREFVHHILEGVNLAPDERLAGFKELDDYLDRQIDEHVADPRDDLTTYLLNVELDGQQLSPRARARLDRAAADRRHRHDVERHRLGALAPRRAPRGPPPPRRRSRR